MHQAAPTPWVVRSSFDRHMEHRYVGVNSSNAGYGESQITRSTERNKQLGNCTFTVLSDGGGGAGLVALIGSWEVRDRPALVCLLLSTPPFCLKELPVLMRCPKGAKSCQSSSKTSSNGHG
jgi:hypothetical protein